MTSHFLLMVLFSALVSLVFSFMTKYGARERIRYFFFLFGAYVLISVVAGWLMFPFPF